MFFESEQDEWFFENRSMMKNIKKVEDFFDFRNINALNPEMDIQEPTNIEVYIDPKTSLIKIHEGIRSKFVYDKTKIKGLNQEMQTLEKIKNNIKKDKYLQQKHNIAVQMRVFNTEHKWEEYKREIIPILERYILVMPPEVEGVVSCQKQSDEIIETCLSLIVQFIEISNSICGLRINTYYHIQQNNICPICETERINEKCNCGYIQENSTDLSEHFSQEDDEEKRTNINPKPQIEWLKTFLCEGNYDEMNQEMFEKMDRLCVKNSLPVSQYVKENPNEATRELLRKIMKLAKMDYKYGNILAHKYWGWEIPCITEEQKDIFIRDCIETRKEYPSISDRKQNLNLDVSGYLLFGLQNITFSRKYFTFPANNEIIRDANEVWVKICQKMERTEYKLIG